MLPDQLVPVLQQQLDELDPLEADEVEELRLQVVRGPLRLEIRKYSRSRLSTDADARSFFPDTEYRYILLLNTKHVL